jgi:4-hydroxybenzoyl-CoA thioesterase
MSFVSRRTVRIEWGDCDGARIVFYPRYFAFFDAAAHLLFERATGMRMAPMTQQYGIMGIPMVDTRGKFHAPCSYGDDVEIESLVARFGRSSFDVQHRLTRDGVLCVEGWETRVWAAADAQDPRKIRGVRIPDEVRAKLA